MEEFVCLKLPVESTGKRGRLGLKVEDTASITDRHG